MAGILYDLESYNLLEFGLMSDESIKLPRYQRPGSQWNPKMKMGFLMSILFGLPTGFITEREDKNGTKWLIDGRQRRECINDVLNPFTLAKIVETATEDEVPDTIDGNNTTTDIDKRIYKFARTWLQEYDDSDYEKYDHHTKEQLLELCAEKGIDAKKSWTKEECIEKLVLNDQNTGLGLEEAKRKKLDPLVDLMNLMKGWADENKEIQTGFTKKFRWKDHGAIYKPEKKEELIIPKFYKFKNNGWYFEPEIFAGVIRDFYQEKGWIEARCTDTQQIHSYLQGEFEGKIEGEKFFARWDEIKDDTVLLFKKMSIFKKKFLENTIGKVHLRKECTAFEGMKIFTIINSKGVPLTEIQLLAAWPEWNQPLFDEEHVCNDEVLKQEVDDLYKLLKVDYDRQISKWDVASTLVNRMNDEFLWNHPKIISVESNNVTRFESKLTKGFQLLAGNANRNMGKSGYKEIHKEITDENWRNNNFVNDHNQMIGKLFGSNYFATLRTWLQKPGKHNSPEAKLSLKNFITDFQLLSFQVALTKYFVKMGKPNSGKKLQVFMRNAFLIFDQLFYQNFKDMWGGQGDSKAQSYIEDIGKIKIPSGILDGVSENNWKNLLNELIGGEINDEEKKGDILDKETTLSQSCITGKVIGEFKDSEKKQKFPQIVKYILIHYYSMSKTTAPNEEWHWDHIVSENAFKTKDNDIKMFCNNIVNCGPLKADLNLEKSDKFLNDPDLKVEIKLEIEKYTGIEEKEYDKYSDVANMEDITRSRGKKIIENFIASRKEINS